MYSRVVPAFVVWITFAVAFCLNPWDDRQVWFGGDQALLLQAADDVLAGDPPLVGAYSKHPLHHPGPLFIYLTALVQWTTRGDIALTNTVLSLIQAATVPVLVLFAQRLTGSWLVALTVPFLIVFNFAFLFYVRIIWNVAIVLPALSLALWLTWEVTPRSTWLLPFLTFVLCFLAQAHLAYTPLAVTLGLVAIARFLSGGFAGQGQGRWRAIAIAAIVALACWSPALWDAARHDGGGNLGALLRYFGEERRGHDLYTAWGSIHGAGLHAMPRVFPLLSALIVSTISIVSTFWGRDEAAAKQVRWLGIVVGCALLVMLLSITRIPGAIEPYYLRPLSILLVVHLLGGVAALLLWLRSWKWVRVARVVEAAIAVAVIAAAAPHAREEWTRFRNTAWNSHPLHEMRVVARAIGSDLRDASAAQVNGGRTPDSNGLPTARVELQPPDLSGAAAAIMYVLRQEGIALARDPRDPRAPRDPHALDYRILVPSDHQAVPASGRQLVRTARFRVERVTSAGDGTTFVPGTHESPAFAGLYVR